MAPSTAETTSWNGFLEKSRLPLYEELEQTDHSDHALPTPDLPGLNDCSLPPYEELKQTDCYDILSLDVPPPTATSTEVADFLVRLLVSTDIPINRARDIASRWTSGSGKELREYLPVLYLEVFGKEDGWALYLAVHQAIHKEKSMDFWYRNKIREYHRRWKVAGP
jgi:hypothetical protein